MGVRARATIAFGLVGMGVAVSLGLLTWLLARSFLVEQREEAALQQAYADARLTRSALRASDPDVASFLTSLDDGDAGVVLRHREAWYSGSLEIDRATIPPDLHRVVAEGGAGRQRFESRDGELRLAVGVPLPAVDASYFEVFSLHELDRSLDVLRNILIGGAIATSLVAGVVGRGLAGRVVRPLGSVATTAREIAAGDLRARLERTDDPDLAPLADAFNTMTDALEERVAREARFASDVSHELRSPLAVLRAATEIIDRRHDQLPEGAASAFDLLRDELADFERMVLDLLEISRFDNAATELATAPVEVEPFVREALRLHAPDATLHVAADAPSRIVADPRRLLQVLQNLCQNAGTYGGGLAEAWVRRGPDGTVVLDLDDDGPGVPVHERGSIFERFRRGSAGAGAGPTTGSGLGLALVAEHVRLHGGHVEALSAPGGGARFRVTLPVERPT